MDRLSEELQAGVRGDADRLRTALHGELSDDRWRPGERLPTEREFSERFGMARNTVRRALRALEDDGLIVRHVGRGTFRAPVPVAEAQTGLDIAGASPADVMECRLIFEPELAALVVARARQPDLERMEECLAGGENSTDVAEFEMWDAALHDAIAVATQNQTVIAVARTLARVRLQAEWGQLKARYMTAQRKLALQADHRAIVDAFRARDKVAARARLVEHLKHVQGYMFGE